MLKTNSKIARTAVRNWIMMSADFTGYDEYEHKEMDFNETAKALLEICNVEKFYQSYPNEEAMLTDWFQGLPSVLDTAEYIYHCNAVDLLGGFLQETEAEKARFTESQAEKMLNHLIADEILKGAK